MTKKKVPNLTPKARFCNAAYTTANNSKNNQNKMNDTEKNGTSASLKIYTHSERALSREVFPRNKRIAYTNSRKRWRNEWKRTVTVSNPTNVKEITHAPTARNLYKQKKTQYACFKTSKIAIEQRRRPRNIKNVLKKTTQNEWVPVIWIFTLTSDVFRERITDASGILNIDSEGFKIVYIQFYRRIHPETP